MSFTQIKISGDLRERLIKFSEKTKISPTDAVRIALLDFFAGNKWQ